MICELWWASTFIEKLNFDTIDLRRLESSFRFRGNTLNWIASYLLHREQYVKCGSSASRVDPVVHGVPQGSVLGPILFTLYIAPLASVINSFGVSHHQYADDTQLYIAISKADCIQKLHLAESCLSSVCEWLSLNYLAINPDKSEAILLGTWQQLA